MVETSIGEDLVMGIVLGFVLMEIFSVFVHKYFFHGVFWFIHKTHHQKRNHWWETNDLFSLFFGSLAVGFIFYGRQWDHSFLEQVGWGISIYGIIYFFIHDLMTHRRYYPLSAPKGWIFKKVQEHRKHHQKNDKKGQGPWGLFSGF